MSITLLEDPAVLADMTAVSRKILEEAKRTGKPLVTHRNRSESKITTTIGDYSVNRDYEYLNVFQFFLSQKGLVEAMPMLERYPNHYFDRINVYNEHRLDEPTDDED
ncbi:MAG TPA: hypothetical protein V6C86_21070 [Oculatellaceae cyanobacterium]